jgi:hypothetical protein
MTHIAGFQPAQLTPLSRFLLPEAVDDCVEGHNLVRFIAFVGRLDLTSAGFARVRGEDYQAAGLCAPGIF